MISGGVPLADWTFWELLVDSAGDVTTREDRCIAQLDVARYAGFLCLAISSRTSGTNSVGNAIIVPEDPPGASLGPRAPPPGWLF